MKFLIAAAVGCLLALSGCANLPDRAPNESTPLPTTADSHTATEARPASKISSTLSLPSSSLLQPISLAQVGSSRVFSMAPPADIWDRLRQGFAMPDLDTPLVHDREQWYATRPDYIFRMADRSRKYLFYIVEELERRGMPTELALLPFVESAFNPLAVSSAKAAGMWQFMPATGTTFDLKQNLFRDDRRDVLASTRAALDYLQKLYGMFGDWHLALAAYNWGEGSVSRAIARNQRQGLGTSYLELTMPNETRYYVPKFQAIKNIVANPELFHTELPDIQNHPYFETVDIPGDIDVALAAKLAEVPLEDFKALNPSVHRPVILAAGNPQILLPWDNAAIFKRNLDTYHERLASWTAWTAPSTMSVAVAAQKLGISEYDLRNVNNIPPRMLIKAGSALIVPRSNTRDSDVNYQIADMGQLSLAPEITTRRTLVKAARKDTVATIAQRYRVSPAQVAEWNDLKVGASLKAGQQVVVFLPVRASNNAKKSRQTEAPATRKKAAQNEPKRGTHTSVKTPVRPAAPANGRNRKR